MKHKKYFFTKAAVCFVSFVFFAGCGQSRKSFEKEEAYRTIGINAMKSGDYAAAMEAFNSALEQAGSIGQNEIDICFYKAAAQFAAGNQGDAIETYNLLLEADDKNSDAYFLRGCVWLKTNESDLAIEDYNMAVKYAANDEIYLAVYNSLNSAGYEAEAKEYLNRALEKKTGGNAEDYVIKGKLYFLNGENEKAAEHLKSAVEKGAVEANLYLAKAYDAMGDGQKAQECIDAYIKENPDSSVSYNQLGSREMENGNYKEAVSYFEKGLSLEKITNEQEIRSNLIAAYEYSGDFKTAKELMREYITDYPKDAAAAREYLFLGKNRDAETE